MANLVTYAKQVWQDAKTAITAARLNNMEKGISDCATQINKLGDSVSLLTYGISGRAENTLSVSFVSQQRAVALVMMDGNGKGKACLYFVSGVAKLAVKLAGNDNAPTWSNDGATVTFKSTDWNCVTVISAGGPVISFA